MKYTVGLKQPGLAVGIMGLVVFTALLAGIIALCVTGGMKDEPEVALLMLAVAAMFVVLSVLQVYRSVRPLVKVNGHEAVYYLAWRKKRTVDLTCINSLKVTHKANHTALLFGVMGYAATGGTSGVVSEFIYFCNGEEVMRITSDMKNADRLDAAIRKQLPQTDD